MSAEKPEDPQKKKRREAAAQAFAHYDNDRFVEATSSLNTLSSQITVEKDAIALEHNSIITSFSSNPKSNENVHNTLRNLQRIRARAIEHRAGKSVVSNGQTDGSTTNNEGSESTSGGNDGESSATPTDATAATSTAPSPDDIDAELAADPQMSTILFNEAVLCCSLGQFRSALVRLEALFQNLMLLDDWLAVRTCYLLLDIYIHVHRGLEANSEALKHLEKSSAKIFEALEQRATSNDEDGNSNGNNNGASSGVSNDENEPSNLKSIPDLKFHLKLYRAKLQLMTSNSKNAKKEIKAALDIYNKDIKNDKTGMSAVAKKTSTPALYLKANLEYVRENFKKSVKLLNAALSNKSLHEAMYMNNMGCVNFQSQRYAVSSMYFSRALTLINSSNDSSGSKKSGGGSSSGGVGGGGSGSGGGSSSSSSGGGSSSSSSSTGNNKTNSPPTTSINQCEVLFNIGLQMLMCDNDLETAFQCFHRSAEELHMRPRVWMRMAECCVAQHEKCLKLKKEKRMENGRHPSTLSAATQYTTAFQNDLVTSIVHSRRVMLPVDDTSSNDGIPSKLVYNKGTKDVSMSMSYAIMCLRNVLYLTKDRSTPKSDTTTTATTTNTTTTSSTTSSAASPLTEKELVRHAALASLSYCSLCQNHPISALDYARRLLTYPCSKGNQYLSHMYAAEALCTMNRCEEALVHVNTAMSLMETDKLSSGETEVQEKGGLASSPASAKSRAALCINLASIRIQQNELDLAEKSLRQALLLSPTSTEALRGMIYLHLRQGQKGKAMQLLQERRPNIR